jgi:hypothetical protein
MCRWLFNIFKKKEEGPVFEPKLLSRDDLDSGLEVGTFSRILLERLAAPHKCEILRLEERMQFHAINRVKEFIEYKNSTKNMLPEEPFIMSGDFLSSQLSKSDGHEGVRDDFEALKSYGLQYPAEILAYGYRTASAVVKAWMNSPDHKRSLLRTKHKYIGVAMREYEGRNYWSVLFAR